MYIFIFFLTVVLIPATMVGFGLKWRKGQSSRTNMLFGYRTTWSMKNQETWNFAHRYVGKIWVIVGVPIAIISVVSWVIFGNSEFPITVTMYLQIAGLLLPVIPTEVALRKNFSKNGKRIAKH